MLTLWSFIPDYKVCEYLKALREISIMNNSTAFVPPWWLLWPGLAEGCCFFWIAWTLGTTSFWSNSSPESGREEKEERWVRLGGWTWTCSFQFFCKPLFSTVVPLLINDQCEKRFGTCWLASTHLALFCSCILPRTFTGAYVGATILRWAWISPRSLPFGN